MFEPRDRSGGVGRFQFISRDVEFDRRDQHGI